MLLFSEARFSVSGVGRKRAKEICRGVDLKVLLIGATGYIGSVVGEWLLNARHDVVGLGRSTDACKKLRAQGFEPLLGDLETASSLVPHLAAFDAIIYAAYGYADPACAQRELDAGKSHLSDILKELHGSGKTFIFTSGSGVFPDTGDVIYTEETSFAPIDSPLNIARLNLELEVRAASRSGVRSIVLRPPTVYGRGGSFMVPRFLLEHARNHRQSIFIEGTEAKKWSVVHLEDLADLFLLALERAPSGSLYNTASESGLTVLSIAQAISRAADLGGTTTAVSLERGREIFGHWADWWSLNNQCSGEKAKQELGWKPHRRAILDDIENGSYALSAANVS